jgi:hypothetical protein
MPSYTICGIPAFLFRVYTSTWYLYIYRSAFSMRWEFFTFMNWTSPVWSWNTIVVFIVYLLDNSFSFIANIKYLLLVLFILSWDDVGELVCVCVLVWYYSCFSNVLFQASCLPPLISCRPWAKVAIRSALDVKWFYHQRVSLLLDFHLCVVCN